MGHRHPVVLAAVPLFVAGAALAFLGVRALLLERAEADRAAAAWADKIVGTLREIAPRLAAAEPYPAQEAIRVEPAPKPFDSPPVATSADDRLLLDEARYLEIARGDDGGALALLVRLAGSVEASPLRDVASLRAGAIARRLGDPRARALLESAAAAPATVAEASGVSVAVLALRHLATLDLAEDKTEHLVALLDAVRDGATAREDGGLDAGDLVLAVADDVANGRLLPEGTLASRLLAASSRARRDHRLVASLREGTIGTDGAYVAARGKEGEVTVRSLQAFGALLASRSGSDAGVASKTVPIPTGANATSRLDAPLDALTVWVRAEPSVSSGRWGWFLGSALLTYALGAALSISAIRGSLRAARMQADFVAAVSHEMKTPIAAVQAMAEMLADGRVEDASRAKTYALRMHAEMQRLGTTVRNVLDAARIERGTGPLVARRRLDPAVVVADLAAVVRPALEARGFRFDVETEPAKEPMPVDPIALSSVLSNLLDNAAKFSGEARELSVVAGPAGKSGRGYRVLVRDRGPGVPAADRPHLFERFWRGDAARFGAVPGVGLGLHVASELVTAHGGTLTVEDREGGGADFVVELPEVPA